LSSEDAAALLASARELWHAAAAGQTPKPLRGKNLGLLCDDDQHDDAVLFRRAATELGAHVAHLRSSLSEHSTRLEIENTARTLARLYDAVECQGMPTALVQQVAGQAGMVVFDAIASAQHPSALLAGQLGSGCPSADARRLVLQAMLLRTVV
jgi:ornithine carbamoyltransferase